jgi:Mg2+ and Co2+ transporter CorA
MYNEREVRQDGSKDDIRQGYNVWMDLIDPTPAELWNTQQSFHLDGKALEEYANKSKKPQVRMLNSHIFTLMLDIKYLKIMYNDINQLIEHVESYQDTVNSTRSCTSQMFLL